jgi:hypothetical protein
VSNTTIQLKYSTATGNTPSSLANGEIAINSFDGKLFYSDPLGVVKAFVADAGPSGLNTEIQFNDAGTMAGSANLTFNKTSGLLSVESAKSNSYYDIKNVVRQISANVTTTNTNQTYILTFPTSGYGSGKFLIQATRGSSRQVTELLVVHDGVTAYATEYAIVRTSDNLFNIDVDILMGQVAILTTSTSANSTTYKVMSTLLSA